MPKLTLRDLFAIVTIVALALGWWLDRSRLAEQNADLESRLAVWQYQEEKRAMINAALEVERAARQNFGRPGLRAKASDQPTPSK